MVKAADSNPVEFCLWLCSMEQLATSLHCMAAVCHWAPLDRKLKCISLGNDAAAVKCLWFCHGDTCKCEVPTVKTHLLTNLADRVFPLSSVNAIFVMRKTSVHQLQIKSTTTVMHYSHPFKMVLKKNVVEEVSCQFVWFPVLFQVLGLAHKMFVHQILFPVLVSRCTLLHLVLVAGALVHGEGWTVVCTESNPLPPPLSPRPF